MRKNLYTFLVAGSLALLLCIFLFAKKPKDSIPAFKERKSSLSLQGEWLNTKKAIEGLLSQIEQDPGNIKALLELSQAYIQEGRITGDHAYYDKAALELLEKALQKQPDNFEALCCKATVLLSQHHFAEGLQLANKALPLNPDNAFIYGILCDANLELGNYHQAVAMADKMVSVRPDIRSYARVSYLREIFGDINGAIAAMRMAVEAGYPGLEQTEWSRCILAHLYEVSGKPDSAFIEYKTALTERPDYPYALAGLGKIEKTRGHYKEAIAYYEKAKTLITEYSFSDELTDLYLLNNEAAKADRNAREVISMLSPQSDVEGENGHGHYADKELAYAYLKINDVEKAHKHALLEYQRRPDNIDVCETLAWVKYKKNELTTASNIVDKALKTGSKNPILLCRAGIIKIKNGQIQKGEALIKSALETNPFLDPELKNEIRPFLALK
jgi:tetratricopeptide (TPR) repeat protein